MISNVKNNLAIQCCHGDTLKFAYIICIQISKGISRRYMVNTCFKILHIYYWWLHWFRL